MKALSIRQPWAWLILHAGKDIENRTWRTAYRGPLLIHAGKTFDAKGYDYVACSFDQIDLPLPHNLRFGGFVGVATLADCVTESDSPWFEGPYGFVLAAARDMPLIEYPGRLGLFDVDESEMWQKRKS